MSEDCVSATDTDGTGHRREAERRGAEVEDRVDVERILRDRVRCTVHGRARPPEARGEQVERASCRLHRHVICIGGARAAGAHPSGVVSGGDSPRSSASSLR